MYILRNLMWNQGAFHLRGLPKGDATVVLVCCMLLPVIKAAIVCILPADCQTCKNGLCSLLICASAISLAKWLSPGRRDVSQLHRVFSLPSWEEKSFVVCCRVETALSAY